MTALTTEPLTFQELPEFYRGPLRDALEASDIRYAYGDANTRADVDDMAFDQVSRTALVAMIGHGDLESGRVIAHGAAPRSSSRQSSPTPSSSAPRSRSWSRWARVASGASTATGRPRSLAELTLEARVPLRNRPQSPAFQAGLGSRRGRPPTRVPAPDRGR
ncbi:hypothetical protein [Terracoccus luteus]|uniref:Uncharacterized protein n=1 Tax=Terracoccus luteus TaxID=53356 RepID=A0A839PVH9_9MICO|nr:hypothetical protein [Terracoccus luteus]MBB2988120.1 hypothetical protein [Terracoccus luteus]MCP2174140.1 hypothetical protein [Terracoccus luteus]